MWKGFSFGVIGDSRLYLNEAVRINNGYLEQNLEAHRNGTETDHVVLVTEGGYQFLIAALRRVFGMRSVFWMQRFLVPLLIATFLCLPILLGKKRTAWAMLPALCFLVWHDDLLGDVLLLRRPLRALPGHLLAMILCWSVLVTENVTPKRCLFWGFLTGFSAWFNFPTILFGLVPTVRILLESGTEVKKIVHYGSILALGGLMGLLPLFAQNLFEGKAFYVIGEMDFLVTDEKPPVPKPYRHLPVEFGLHPKNFRWIFPSAVQYLFQTSPGILWNSLVGFGVLGMALFRRKAFGILLAGILPSFLFYCMFHGFISRYYVVPHLLLLTAAAAGLVEWTRVIVTPRWPRLRKTVMGVIVAVLVVGTAANLQRLRHPDEEQYPFTFEDLASFGEWIDRYTHEDSLFLTRYSQLSAWINWTGNRIQPQTSWAWSAGSRLHSDKFKFIFKDVRNFEYSGHSDRDRISALLERVQEGREVIFLQWIPENENLLRISSWWKGDVEAHCHLEPVGPDFEFPSSYPYRIRALRMVPFREEQTIPLPDRKRDETRLLVFSRFPEDLDLLNQPAWIQLKQSSSGKVYHRVKWQPGYHILDIPSLPEEGGWVLEIEGKRPEPLSVQWTRPDQVWGRHMKGNNMEFLPLDVRMVQPVIARMRGSKDWGRDGSSDPVNYVRNRYRIRLSDDQKLFLPSVPDRGVFHMFLARIGDEKSVRDLLSEIQVDSQMGSQGLHLTFLTTNGVEGAESQHRVEEGMLLVSGDLAASGQAPYLQIKHNPAVVQGAEPDRWELRGIYFQEVPEFPSFMPDDPLAESSLRVYSVQGLGPKGPLETLGNSNYRLLHLSCGFEAPADMPPRGWVKLEIGSWSPEEQRHLEFVLSGKRGVHRYRLQADVPQGKDTLVLIPYHEPWDRLLISTPHSTIEEAPPLYVSLPSFVPVTTDGQVPSDLDLFSQQGRAMYQPQGFYPAETLPDGKPAMWASGSSSFNIPLSTEGTPEGRKEMELRIRGPIQPESPAILKVQFSPDHATEISLPSWEEGWQTVRVALPPEVLQGSALSVHLTGPVWRPADVMESSDDRTLSFYLRRVRILMQ